MTIAECGILTSPIVVAPHHRVIASTAETIEGTFSTLVDRQSKRRALITPWDITASAWVVIRLVLASI